MIPQSQSVESNTDTDKTIQHSHSQPFSTNSSGGGANSQQTSILSSPTKSIKNYFKNRQSLKSIESITQTQSNRENEENLSATASPSKITGLLMRPKFNRSRSSMSSNASAGAGSRSGGAGAGATVGAIGSPTPGVVVTGSPTRITQTKPVEIDDFADSTSNSGSEYDAESINSILDEYESMRRTRQKMERDFLFREEFDDMQSQAEKEVRREQSMKSLRATKVNVSREIESQRQRERDIELANIIQANALQEKENLVESGGERKSKHNSDGSSSSMTNRQSAGSSSNLLSNRNSNGSGNLLSNRNSNGSGNLLGNRTSHGSGENRSSIVSGNSSKSFQRTSRSKSLLELTLGDTHHLTNSDHSVNSPTSYYDAKQSETNSLSSGSHKNFKIYNDHQEAPPLPYTATSATARGKSIQERRKVISASSNVDTANRSSLYNLTTISNFDTNDQLGKEDVQEKQIAQEAVGSSEGNAPGSAPTAPAGNRAYTARGAQSNTSSMYISVNSGGYDNTERSEYPLQPHNQHQTIRSDEIALQHNDNSNKTQNTDTFSLSSGELLNTLQSYYGESNTKLNAENNADLDTNPFKDPRPGSVAQVVNVRLSTESPTRKLVTPVRGKFRTSASPSLYNPAASGGMSPTDTPTPPPVHLFSVNKQPLISPERAVAKNMGGTARPSPSQRSTSAVTMSQGSQDSRITEYINKNLNNGIQNFRHSQPMGSSVSGSHTSFSSIRAPSPIGPFQDTIERQTSHERMLNDEKDVSGLLYPGGKRPDKANKGDIFTPHLLEKERIPPHSSASFNTYSWSRWILLCLCGLIAPPVFFLIAMGSFDSRSNPSSCYSGVAYYTGEQIVRRRRFSKKQKVLSVILGLLWCAIVMAMIGVGFGIGIKNEKG